jgi:uncharacterized membrane protein YoaK (UPF0700 family)
MILKTRRQPMGKKIFYWAATILQVLFFIAAYGIQFFSMKRMGMMRYVVFINREWEAQYPITTLKYSAIVFLVVLCAAGVLYKKTKKNLPMLIAGILITLIFVFFTLVFSTENYRSYYFTSLILAFIALIQQIKILLAK